MGPHPAGGSSVIYLDTHAVAWLAALGPSALGAEGRRRLESDRDLRISPMVRLELEYLHEVGRIRDHAVEICERLAANIGLRICDAPFFAVIHEAERRPWTRDPYDRIIVAHAAVHDAPLVTKDLAIHEAYPGAVW